MANDPVEEIKQEIEQELERKRELKRKRYHANKVERAAYQRDYTAKVQADPEKRIARNNRVGNARLRRLEAKAGRPKPDRCEICHSSDRITFDHSHRSDKFRGWICHKCNVILGLCNDDPLLLEKLAVYVRSHDGE